MGITKIAVLRSTLFIANFKTHVIKEAAVEKYFAQKKLT